MCNYSLYALYICVPICLQLPSNTETLKKHLLLLFDRLEKGGRLVSTTTSLVGGGGAGSAAGAGGAGGGKAAGTLDGSASGKTRISGGGNGVNSRVDVKQAK